MMNSSQQYLTPAQKKHIERETAYYSAMIASYRRERQKETRAERDKRIAHLVKPENYAEFCAYYFPHIVRVKMPEFHVGMRMAMAEPNAFEAFKWSRGFSKTTNSRMVRLHQICGGDIYFSLLISATNTASCTLLAHLQAEVEHNEALRNDFGLAPKFGHWSRGELILERNGYNNYCCRAFGKGESVRGQQNDGRRPDDIELDDIDDDEACRNTRRTRNEFDWVKENVMGAVEAGDNYRFRILNTVLSSHSVMMRVCEMEGIRVHETKATKPDGSSSWPEKVSLEWLNKQKARIGYHSYMKEYMLEPLPKGDVFKPEYLTYTQLLPLPEYSHIVAYCDSSYVDTGDYKAVTVLGYAPDMTYHVLNVFCKQCSHTTLINWMYDEYERIHTAGGACSWYVEGGFVQMLPISLALKEAKDKRGFVLPLSPQKVTQQNKEGKISTLSTQFEAGLIYFGEQLQKSADYKVFREQLLSFGHGSRAHDDGPDSLYMAWDKLAHRVKRKGSDSQGITRGSRPNHNY